MNDARQNLLDALEVLNALKGFAVRGEEFLRAWEKAEAIAKKAADEYVRDA